MVRILFILLICSSAFGQAFTLRDQAFTVVSIPSISGTNIACDLWYDMEMTAVSTAQLDLHDHGTGTSAIVDASSKLSLSASGENHTIDLPQNTADSGTNGLSVDTTTGAAAFIQSTIAAVDSVSIAAWVKAPSFGADAATIIMVVTDAGSTTRSQIGWRRSGGNYDFRCAASGANQSIGSGLTADAWYWITLKYIKSGTCSFAVFNSTGAQVGVTRTDTDSSATQITKCRIGNITAITGGVAYFDDFLIDKTSAQFPLGP